MRRLMKCCMPPPKVAALPVNARSFVYAAWFQVRREKAPST
jgi:hypothetical protein